VICAASLGLAPDEAWRLTPRELALYAEGDRRRRDEAYEVFAHFTACVLTALSGQRRRIRGEDILRPRKPGPRPSRAHLGEIFEQTVAMMGPGAKPVRGGGGKCLRSSARRS